MKRTPSIWAEHLVDGVFCPEFPENSMYEFLVEKTASALEDIAIEFEGVQTTYAEFLSQIDAVAASLLALGVKKGDVITIASPNIPQAVITIYAANKVGAVSNMLHPLLTAAEMQYHVENTESKAFFVLDKLYEKLEGIKWTDQQPVIVLFSVADALTFPKNLFVRRVIPKNRPDGLFLWREFLKNRAPDPVFPASSPDDLALILYSGGTTGAQKGVCLTNWNVNCYAVQHREVGAGHQRLRSLAVMPIFHGLGLLAAIHGMLACCFHLYLVPAYDAQKCNRLIFKNRIESIMAVPAIYDALIHSDEMKTKDYRFLKLIVCGGDKLSARTERTFNAYMEKINSPTRILQGYGMTECAAGCLCNAMFKLKEGTVGIPYPDAELVIVEPGTEKELPVGTPGELCVCSPSVMKGYYKDEAATQKALHVHVDGKTWLHTGDVFSVDEDGFYTFHNRLSRMLVVNGYNVYPEMVENALQSIPGVSKSCVIGKPARAGGERIIAVVCLSQAGLSPADIRKECKTRLPEYAVPHQVMIRDDLPVTKVGKVDFQRLAKEIAYDGSRNPAENSDNL